MTQFIKFSNLFYITNPSDAETGTSLWSKINTISTDVWLLVSPGHQQPYFDYVGL